MHLKKTFRRQSMIKYYFLFLFIGIKVLCFAQDRSYKLRFNLYYAKNEIVKGEKIFLENDNWITFSKLKFFAGNPTCFENGKVISDFRNQYYLVDFADSAGLEVGLDLPSSTDSLCISIGTDSITNVSGIYEGALDPLNGMYWAWNSGYINYKIEGSSSYVLNEDRKFEFHVGGYISPNATVRQICITLYSEDIILNIDLSKVMEPNLLNDTPSITIPGKNANAFANGFKESFYQTVP